MPDEVTDNCRVSQSERIFVAVSLRDLFGSRQANLVSRPVQASSFMLRLVDTEVVSVASFIRRLSAYMLSSSRQSPLNCFDTL